MAENSTSSPDVVEVDNFDAYDALSRIPNQPEKYTFQEQTARIYQAELIDKAIKQNLIICLPTGSGKTFIALKVAQHYLRQAIENKQKIIFLANTVQLVVQQTDYFKKNISPLSTDREFVKSFVGADGVDLWNEEKWRDMIDKCDIMVMSTEILKNILNIHIQFKEIALLIFDECHHSQKNHPMNSVMEKYRFTKTSDPKYPIPRILGLSATVISGDTKETNLAIVIGQMEENLDSKAITYHDYEEVLKYSTNAIVRIERFDTSNFDQSFLQPILEGQNDLKQLQRLFTNEWLARNKQVFREMDAVLEDVKICYNELGPACARIAACIRTCELTAKILTEDKEEKKWIMTITRTFLLSYRSPVENRKFSNVDHSPKVQLLLTELRKWKDKPEELCSLIFVKRRITAIALHWFLKGYFEEHSDTYGFIKNAFVVGASSSKGSGELTETISVRRHQKVVIEKFFRKEYNLIVCTDVLEEGLNVPACNVIYKFDDNLSFRSLIQSSGRARNQNASYIIFTSFPIEMQEKINDYHNYKQKLAAFLCEKALHVESDIQDPIDLGRNDDMDNKLIPEFRPGNTVESPSITRQDVISRVHEYCTILSTDKYTLLLPEFRLLEGSFPGTYKGVVMLPAKSVVIDPVTGPEMPTKVLAKQGAFMEVCKKLYELGELDHNTLLPVRPNVSSGFLDMLKSIGDEVSSDLDRHKSTQKFGNWFPKKRPDHFEKQFIEPDSKLHCYRICLKLLEPKEIEKEELYNFKDRRFFYGILLKQKLDFIPPFHLISRMGTLECTLENITDVFHVSLSNNEIQRLIRFQKHLFEDMLELKNLSIADLRTESECLIIPLVKSDYGYDVSWTLLQDIKEFGTDARYKYLEENKNQMDINYGLYEDAIIVPFHRPADGVNYHCVIGINHEITPSSPFDDLKKAKDYKEYYNKQYGVVFKYPTQPGLRCCKIAKQLNFLTKPKPGDRKAEQFRMRRDSVLTLFPELVQIFPFPGSLYVQGKMLPSILHRIERLCLAREIRMGLAEKFSWELAIKNDEERQALSLDSFEQMVSSMLDVDMPQLPVDSTTTSIKEDRSSRTKVTVSDIGFMDPFQIGLGAIQEMFQSSPEDTDAGDSSDDAPATRLNLPDSNDICFDYLDKDLEMQKEAGPSLITVMEAITVSGANDCINLERLEMIGDSVLKLAATLHIVSHFSNYTEGQMTQLRTALISNKTLRNFANKANLGEIMSGAYFFCEHNFLPRSYELQDKFVQVVVERDATLDMFGCDPEKISRFKEMSANEILKEVKTTIRSNAPKGRILSHSRLRDKDLADCVEALIGAYFTNGGMPAALKLMEFIGLEAPVSATEFVKYGDWSISAPPIDHERIGNRNPMNYIPYFDEIEKLLQYKFNNPWLLVQALTHPSYCKNKCTSSYENLEFLGDAVLDFLVTNQIYNENKSLNPGQLTDLRSALVNNVTFASLVVRYDLHKFMLRMSQKLDSLIDNFVVLQKQNNHEVWGQFTLVTDLEAPVSKDVETPKALGDIFESIAGAVFLDCGGKLGVTWKIFYRLMKNEIDKFSKNVPKAPLRLVHELDPHLKITVKRGNATDGNNYGKTIACIKWKNEAYYGVGNSERSAKEAVAKYVVRALGLQSK